MPNYLDLQIAEALTKAKGNKTNAGAALIRMAAEDQRLLLELARPYLKAMAAQALNHHVSQQGKKRISLKTGTKISQKAMPQGEEGGFGLDLLKALGGNNVAKFGQESAAPPVRRKPASTEHADTLRMLASKSKTKPAN